MLERQGESAFILFVVVPFGTRQTTFLALICDQKYFYFFVSRTEVFVASSTAGSEDRRSSEGVFLQRFAVSEEAQKRLSSPVLAVMHQLSGRPVHQGTFLLVRNIFVESRMKVFLLSLIATVSVASAGQEGRG